MAEYDEAMKEAKEWANMAEDGSGDRETAILMASMYARIAQAAATQDVAYWIRNAALDTVTR